MSLFALRARFPLITLDGHLPQDAGGMIVSIIVLKRSDRIC